MIACPTCAREWPDEARFCMHCGTPLTPSPAQPEERKIVTSLFCDLVGFTAACEQADAEDVDEVLRAYGAMTARTIESHGGTVEKFIGDAVVGVFGVPVAHEDDPERAVRAALRIVEDAAGVTGIGGCALELRVGVNTGEALVRLNVSPGSGQGFLTGDAVNTAARLQAAAPPMAVVVGDLTRALSERAIIYEELAPLSLRGKRESLRAWRAKEVRSRTGEQDGGAPPFCGRADQVETLMSLFERACATGVPTYCLLLGEPGIGKTRLLREFAHRIHEHPDQITWCQGACLPYGDGVTFAALAEIVKGHAGILDSDVEETVEGKLDDMLPESDRKAWLRQRLRPLVGLDAAEATREERFAAWSLFLAGLAEQRPCVLVVEDLHWADDGMLAFLATLVSQTPQVPLMLIATARPELLARQPELFSPAANVSRLELRPLPTQDAELLLSLLLHDQPADAMCASILPLIGGNPLFAEEYVRLLLDRDLLVSTAAGLSIREGLELSLPETVQAVLAARLDTLPLEAKAVLCDAAVFGERFWTEGLSAMATGDRDHVHATLRSLAERQFIRPVVTSSVGEEAEYSFWHGLVRDVAYQQLPRRVRLAKHIAAAAWIEDEAGRGAAQPEILAHHYLAAHDLAVLTGDAEKGAELAPVAGRHLLAAAEHSLALDLDVAERQLERALGLLPGAGAETGRCRHLLGRTLCFRGRPAEGVAVYREAARLLLDAGQTSAAGRALVEAASWMANAGDGQWRDAFDRGSLLLQAELPSVDGVQALQETAMTMAFRLMDYRGAVTAADQALEWAAALQLPPPPEVYEIRALARGALRDPDWLEDYDRAIAEGERQGLGGPMGRMNHNWADVLCLQRGPRVALGLFRDNADFCRRWGDEYWVQFSSVGAYGALVAAGEWQQARVEGAALLERVETSGYQDQLAMLYSALALLRSEHRAAGRSREEQELARWLSVSGREVAADVQGRAVCVVAGATLHALQGLKKEALRQMADWIEVNPPQAWCGSCEGNATGLMPRAVRLSIALGDVELARRWRGDASPFTPADRLAVKSVSALLEESSGRRAAAATGFAAAAAGWHDFGVPYEEAHALLGEGRCLLALARAPEAAPVLEAAGRIFARLRAPRSLAESRGLLAEIANTSGNQGRGAQP